MHATESKSSSNETVTVTKTMRCTAFVLGHLCNTELEGSGHADSGFCPNCYYPTIAEDYARYRELRKEGMSRNDAAASVGIDVEQISAVKPHAVTEVKGTYGRRNVSKYNQLELQREQQLNDGAVTQVLPERTVFDIPVFMASK